VLSKNSLPFSSSPSPESVCDACQQAKSHQLPYPISTSTSKAPLELIFSDVWGPAYDSIGRYKYYDSFIDDFSKFTWIYLLKHKSDVFQKFQEFQHLVERLFDKKIFVVQTNWVVSIANSIPSFSKLVFLTMSCVPMLINGSAKRIHHHIVEVGLSLLAHASMPLKYWDEAFIAVTYLINHLPTKTLDVSSPLERLFDKNQAI
jgi:hypothetical protein